jgi:hypothetical protein
MKRLLIRCYRHHHPRESPNVRSDIIVVFNLGTSFGLVYKATATSYLRGIGVPLLLSYAFW